MLTKDREITRTFYNLLGYELTFIGSTDIYANVINHNIGRSAAKSRGNVREFYSA